MAQIRVKNRMHRRGADMDNEEEPTPFIGRINNN